MVALCGDECSVNQYFGLSSFSQPSSTLTFSVPSHSPVHLSHLFSTLHHSHPYTRESCHHAKNTLNDHHHASDYHHRASRHHNSNHLHASHHHLNHLHASYHHLIHRTHITDLWQAKATMLRRRRETTISLKLYFVL